MKLYERDNVSLLASIHFSLSNWMLGFNTYKSAWDDASSGHEQLNLNIFLLCYSFTFSVQVKMPTRVFASPLLSNETKESEQVWWMGCPRCAPLYKRGTGMAVCPACQWDEPITPVNEFAARSPSKDSHSDTV